MIDLISFEDNTHKAKVMDETILDEKVATELANIIKPLLEKGKSITVELNHISAFKGEGYNILSDLFRFSILHNNMLKFTHVHDDIFELIDAFSYEEEG